jgi:hypothetical protein
MPENKDVIGEDIVMACEEIVETLQKRYPTRDIRGRYVSSFRYQNSYSECFPGDASKDKGPAICILLNNEAGQVELLRIYTRGLTAKNLLAAADKLDLSMV